MKEVVERRPVTLRIHEDALPCMPREVKKIVALQNDTVAVLRDQNVIEYLHTAESGILNLYGRSYVSPPENEVCSLASLHDDRVLFGCLDGSMGICTLGSSLPSVRIHAMGGGAVVALGFTKTGEQVAVASQDGTLRVGRVGKDGTLTISRTSDKHESSLLSLAWSPDASMIAVGTADGLVRVYRKSTSQRNLVKCIKQFKVPDGKDRVCINSLQWSADWILAGDSLGQVTIWPGDLDNVNAFSFKSHLADILTLSFAQINGMPSVLACGVDHRVVQLGYDGSSWNKVISRRICTHDVTAMAIVGGFLILGSADGVVKSSALDHLNDKSRDHLYSALPHATDIKRASAFFGTGKLHLLDQDGVWAIIFLNDPLVVDHAVTAKFACVATDQSLKFFAVSKEKIDKIVSFEGFVFQRLDVVSEHVFLGLSIDNELWHFDVSNTDVFKKRIRKIPEVVTCLCTCGDNYALGTIEGNVHTNSKVFKVAATPLSVYVDKDLLVAYLEENHIFIHFNGVSSTFKCPMELKFRPVRGIVSAGNSLEHPILIIYNESFAYSLRPQGGDREPVWTKVDDFPNHALLLRFQDDFLDVTTRPWEHILQDLPPAFDVPKYGLK